MPELRWILIAFGLALLIGIYVWGRRSAKAAVADDAVASSRPDPVFETPDPYEQFERPLVPPLEDVEIEARPQAAIEVERRELRDGANISPRFMALDESQEPTIEARVERPSREIRPARIEPTFAEESVTAELPVKSFEPAIAPSRAPAQPPSSSQPASEPGGDAPTLSMSDTPQPRRIERRKIIALRLAAGAQRLHGAQLRGALESESLQHGKYDVFHRLDKQGASIFSVASMVEPGTFDLEKMAQESFTGITLFAQLPAPVAGMLAFNELIACSRRLHAALGGTLQDERGVPLTVHRIERIRQEIREFEQRPASDSQRSDSSYSTP